MNIVICAHCKGTGKLTFDVGTHNSEFETEDCDKCKGSGRMVEEISITHEPFVPGEESNRVF